MKAVAVVITAALLLTGSRLASIQETARSALIDAPQLLLDLKTLSADEMEGRQVGTPGSAKARAYMISRFKQSGIAPFGASYEVPFTFSGRGGSAARQGVNVVGRIKGTRRPQRYIVVSAHYDHLGTRN